MDSECVFPDLILFDLDGTLVNSESLHYDAYNIASGGNIDRQMYCNIQHSSTPTISIGKNIRDIKSSLFKKSLESCIHDNSLQLMPGAAELIRTLHENRVEMCIVTHSSKETLLLMKQALPELTFIPHAITRDDYSHAKPHPECYLKALAMFPNAKRVCAFEDTEKGYMALQKAGIHAAVWVTSPSNCCTKHVSNDVITIDSLSNIPWDELRLIWEKPVYDEKHLSRAAELYSNAINQVVNEEIFGKGFRIIEPLVSSCKGRILIGGIGKCGYIAQKCVSTWLSVGLKASYIDIPNLSHGDYGIINEHDVILYISNSGETEEIITSARYLKNTGFKNTLVAITLKKENRLARIVDFHICLAANTQIYEIDNLNMAPSTTSVILMTFLDILGIDIAQQKGLSMGVFQKMHPGGSLGLKSENPVDAVVIVASGSGTRLRPRTDTIPKVLVSINGKPFLHHMLDYYCTHVTNNFIIVVQPCYIDLVQFYIDIYPGAKGDISIRSYSRTDGTAATIAGSLHSADLGKNLLITWCDIVPMEPLDLSKLTDTTVFTHGDECRYTAQNGVIKHVKSGGNVVGIWYIQKYRGIRFFKEGQDIADVFVENAGSFKTYELRTLMDMGDEEKYQKIVKAASTAIPCRYFNKVEVIGDIVRKTALTNEARKLQERELAWYNMVKGVGISTPHITNVNPVESMFEMSLIDGEPVYTYLTRSGKRDEWLIKAVIDALTPLHAITSNVAPDIIARDIMEEAYTKVVSRITQIRPIIEHFKLTHVNGVEIPEGGDAIAVARKCADVLLCDIPQQYSLIHGDTNFSNTLINTSTKAVTFVDPRGYFGKSELYGLAEYDIAKILYAMSGYDELNAHQCFGVDIRNGNIQVTDNLQEWPPEALTHFTKKHYVWLAIIYLSLTAYISNDANKVIYAYAKGMYYYTLA